MDRIKMPKRPAHPHIRPIEREMEEMPKRSGISSVAVGTLDRPLLAITGVLAFLGLIAVLSASARESIDNFGYSTYFFLHQLVYMVLGFIGMIVISRTPFFRLVNAAKPLTFIVIGLLTYTMLHGIEANGAERWISICGFRFQPSEFGKITVLLLMAQAFGRQKSFGGIVINVFLALATIGLIYQQPSLGTSMLMSAVMVSMMFISGVPLILLGSFGTVGLVGIVYKLMHSEYQMRRIHGWLNPWADPQDSGFNLIHSLYAIGSGGLFGTGLGMSHQKLYYLPFPYTDFIFSIWAEEWGFIGCLVLLGLFAGLLSRGIIIAKTCRNPIGQLLAMGIVLLFAYQIMINICVASGLLPVTGITLPLFSYGGTSVLVTLAMIGILLNISRYRVTVSDISQLREV